MIKCELDLTKEASRATVSHDHTITMFSAAAIGSGGKVSKLDLIKKSESSRGIARP